MRTPDEPPRANRIALLPLAIFMVNLFAHAPVQEEPLAGNIVPRDFQAIVAPQNTLRLPHWYHHRNSWISSVLPRPSSILCC